MEDIDPHALVGPTHKAVIERLARAVDFRSIDPSTAGLQDMHDAADHTPVINTRLAARIIPAARRFDSVWDSLSV